MKNYKYNHSYNALRRAIQTALAVGAFTVLPLSSVYAAEDGAEEADQKILVTGSRIRRDEFSSASPIQVLTADDAKKSGITNIGQMLTQMSLSNGQQLDELSTQTQVIQTPLKPRQQVV